MTGHFDPESRLRITEKWLGEGISPIDVKGLTGTARSFALARILEGLERPCLVIVPGKKDAERLYKDLLFFLSSPEKDSRVFWFPPYDISPLSGLSPHREIINSRLQALYSLITEKTPVVITCLDALFFRIMPKKSFIGALDYLEVNEEVDREALIRRLEVTGYLRSSLVEERGDYSVRGGVIDLFPPMHSMPVRLEFWGNKVESMRLFDPVSQRSESRIAEITVLPACEIIRDKVNIERARSMGRLPTGGEEGMGFPGQEAWLNHFYPELDSLFDYLPLGGVVAVFDDHRMEALLKKAEEKFSQDIDRFRKESAEKTMPFPELEGISLSYGEMEATIEKYQKVRFSAIDLADKEGEGKAVEFKGPFILEDELEVRLAGKGRVSLAPLAEKISSWIASDAKVVLVTRTEQQALRLRDILANYDVEVDSIVEGRMDFSELMPLTICIGRLASGFVWPDLGLYVISEDEIFGSKRASARRRSRPMENALTWSSFSQLKAGDAVVHEDHGIGLYVGLVKMEVQSRVHDFIIVEYSNNDKLYIPADRVSVLQKYVGMDEGEPKLDRLGGRSWDLVKQRARQSVKRIAKQLIELYAIRKYRKGFSFSMPDHLFAEFEATFEHEETPDQVKAINDVLDDMCSESPMDRLICGDVGFGKTEVAVRAAFKAVNDGKQVAVLVPTTVLAEQHFETFHKRMEPYSISVGILSRFKTPREQSEILAKARSGKIDVLIGTHRMLQKDVKFKDLGLLVIDEEQRFGVKQKEALKKFRSLVDVLAITATPIPRTFQMSMMGVRDLTVIETPPEDRLAIQTYLSRYDEALIARAIRFEMERGGQVFFVHNKVQSIEMIRDRLKELVPEARMAVAHGQMKGRDLENKMFRFIKREFDVLVCTTIIESGLDIPSANTIIINEADRLGLAQIYQLRGRVGRSDEKAYAYLMVSEGANLTRDAEKRLKALMDFTHLGAGLHLAMHDLKIRGGGNVLGFSQSGHISAIGYELYLKLIEQAMAELKGEEWHDDINPEINVDIPAFLPGDYVVDTDVRLNLYRRLSGIRDKSDLEAMKEEITDRFGPPPEEVGNLIKIMSLRLVLKKAGVSGLDVGRSAFTIAFAPNNRINIEKLVAKVNSEPYKYRFVSENKLRVSNKLALPGELGKIEGILETLNLVSRD